MAYAALRRPLQAQFVGPEWQMIIVLFRQNACGGLTGVCAGLDRITEIAGLIRRRQVGPLFFPFLVVVIWSATVKDEWFSCRGSTLQDHMVFSLCLFFLLVDHKALLHGPFT